MEFRGRRNPLMLFRDRELPGKVNRKMQGKDPRKWQRTVHVWTRGVSRACTRGNRRRLYYGTQSPGKFDLVVKRAAEIRSRSDESSGAEGPFDEDPERLSCHRPRRREESRLTEDYPEVRENRRALRSFPRPGPG